MYLITTIENLRILDGPPSTNTITRDCLYGVLVKVTIGYRNTFYFLGLVLFTHVRHRGIKDSIVFKVTFILSKRSSYLIDLSLRNQYFLQEKSQFFCTFF